MPAMQGGSDDHGGARREQLVQPHRWPGARRWPMLMVWLIALPLFAAVLMPLARRLARGLAAPIVVATPLAGLGLLLARAGPGGRWRRHRLAASLDRGYRAEP
ncbi:hypothetical protein ACU4GD_21315 [Cupriavidus basilensis]